MNKDAELYEWVVEASYYSRYYAVYALLQKCGIKSEIHDCSINLLKFLFGEKIDKSLIKKLETAKDENRPHLLHR